MTSDVRVIIDITPCIFLPYWCCLLWSLVSNFEYTKNFDYTAPSFQEVFQKEFTRQHNKRWQYIHQLSFDRNQKKVYKEMFVLIVFFCNPWKEYSIHETKTWLMSNIVTSTFLLPYEKCEIFSDLKGCFLPVKLTHPSFWRLLIDYKRTRSRFSRTKSDNGYMPLIKYRLDEFMVYSCLYYSEID